MNYLGRTLAATVAASLLTGGAYAADLGRGSLKDAPAATPDYLAEPSRPVNWTAFYLGVQGGYLNANHEIDVPVTGDGESFNLLNLDGLNSRGFIGGGTIGFDKQIGNWVVGIQAFYHFSNAETTLNLFEGELKASLEKEEEFGGVVRLGRLLGSEHRTLVYGLGGWAQGKYSLHASTEGEPVDFSGTGVKTSNDFSGPIAGIGVEYALTNYVSIGGEYTHAFYGKETWFKDGGEGGSIAVTDSLDEDRVMLTLKARLSADLFSR